jgi:hypothetical protein
MLVAAEGSWRAEILSVWPRKRDVINGQKIDFVCPMGDVDAPIAQVFDALQHAGILDDDARVCEVQACNAYCKDMRLTVVRLSRVDPHPWRRAFSPSFLAMVDTAIAKRLKDTYQ